MKFWPLIAAACVAAPGLADPISGYTAFELRPAVLGEGVTQSGGNKAVAAKLNANIDKQCGARIAQWNSLRHANEQAIVLLIEPHLTKVKFVGGNSRFWLGFLKGDSDIVGAVRFVDAANGKMLAEEPFLGHGNGFKGMVTIGATDNLMITRVANSMCDYIVRNVLPGSSSITAETSAAELPGDEETAKSDLYAELIKLDDLRKRGILTDEEFEVQKRKILASSHK